MSFGSIENNSVNVINAIDQFQEKNHISLESSPLRRALEQPPLKKIKVMSTQEAGTVTEPESLGPCEPGTSISLEGVIWNETEGGLLSLNLNWRGKTFVGTLMDTTETDHGSMWTTPWHADEIAPDKRPKKDKKKKNKCKKKKKSVKKSNNHVEIHTEGDAFLSSLNCVENEAVVDIKTSVTPKNTEIKCPNESCEKKFSSSNALTYHTSFAHESSKSVLPSVNVNPVKTDKIMESKPTDLGTSSQETSDNSQSLASFPVTFSEDSQQSSTYSSDGEESKELINLKQNVSNWLESNELKGNSEQAQFKHSEYQSNIYQKEETGYQTGVKFTPISPKLSNFHETRDTSSCDDTTNDEEEEVVKSVEHTTFQSNENVTSSNVDVNISNMNKPQHSQQLDKGENILDYPSVIDLTKDSRKADLPQNAKQNAFSDEDTRCISSFSLNNMIQNNSQTTQNEIIPNNIFKETNIEMTNKQNSINKSPSPIISVKTEFNTGHMQSLKHNIDNAPTQASKNPIINSLLQSGNQSMRTNSPQGRILPGYVNPRLSTDPLGLNTLGHGTPPSYLTSPNPYAQSFGSSPNPFGPSFLPSPNPYVPNFNSSPNPYAQSFSSSLAALNRSAMNYKSERKEQSHGIEINPNIPPAHQGYASPHRINQDQTNNSEVANALLRHEHTHTHLHLGFNLPQNQ